MIYEKVKIQRSVKEKMKKKLLFVACIVLAIILMVGCSNQQKAEEKKEDKGAKDVQQITVYISGPQNMVEELESKFEEGKGDVLDIFHTGCGPLVQKVWTEMEAGQIQADVIWGAEPLLYMGLKEKGVLEQYNSSQKQYLKPEYNMGDGYFTLVNARYGVILYNKDKVKESNAPKSWVDLKNSKWKGKIAMADATQSAMALALNVALYQLEDNTWEMQKALKKNEVLLTKQNVEAVAKVDNGEVEVAIAPHDGVLRLQKKAKKLNLNSPLKIVWPKEGSFSVQRPIAIIKNEKRSEEQQALAKEFVDFTLSTVGQNIATKYGFITVRKDLKLPSGIPENTKAIKVNWGFASENEKDIRQGFKEIMFGK